MVTVQGEIVIERPREEVFEFVANGENEPRYNPQMRVAKKITEGPIGAGTSFSQEIVGRRKIVPMTTEFTEFDRPRRIAEVSTWTGGTSRGGLTFEPVDGSTLMRWSWDVQAQGVLRFMGPLVASIGRRQERRIWTGLKQLLEAGRSARSTSRTAASYLTSSSPPAATPMRPAQTSHSGGFSNRTVPVFSMIVYWII